MYNLPYHKEKDPKVVKDFIDKHPFAFLCGCDKNNMPVASQVPVFIEEENGKKVLRGHIMKNTDHHKAFLHNNNVLVVFSGFHTYVSGTWYSNPNTPSTWNYMSVHAKGTIRFMEGKALEDILRKTSLHFENYNNESSTVFDNLPKEFIEKVMPAIVAFEITITEMDNVFKLSQDRDEKSYHNIIEKLNKMDASERNIANEMEKRTKQQSPEK